ncbi:MAG: glycosyltransferase family 9 protein [Bacteroidales bacterium]
MKILVIRFSSIGDIVLTTPVIRCLKQQLPGLELHYLTKERFRQVLELNPYIDRLITVSSSLNEVTGRLQEEKYDQIIDLHKNLRSVLTAVKLRRPRYSFPKLNLRKWLAVRMKIFRLPEIHIVDRYFKAVEHLGVTNDRRGLDYFLGPDDEVPAGDLPESFQDGYIGWVIGGNHQTKIFPEERVIEVCQTINRPVVLLGGKEDAERGERIAGACGPKVFNACGRYALNQSAWLVLHAEKIVTNDTGLMHIAAAFRKPVISLWGNTVPEFGMTPYMPENENKSLILEAKGLSCRPCSKLGYPKCPKGHFDCMMKIDTRRLSEELKNG